MQLRISLPLANNIAGSGFRYSTSSLLAGITVIGAFSTVIYNSATANSKIGESFEKFSKALTSSILFDGINKIGSTFKTWGTTIVSSKDEFRQWLIDYFNASGLKSGAVNLYEKLLAWGTIVYEWFRDKFLKFIRNIPWIVQNWRSIRLSLFKWGTFLGGGGGSAFFSMLGAGDNWDKFSELMGSPEFADIAEKFGKLMEDNSGAFADMDEEELKDMFQSILDDPSEAKKNIEELLQDQKEMNEESKDEEKKEKELSKEAILEKLNTGQGGAPKSEEVVFQNMMSDGINALVNLHENSFFGSEDPEKSAKKAMEEHLAKIKEKVKKTNNKAQKQFLDALNEEGKEKEFVEAMAKATAKAFLKVPRSYGKVAFEKLSEEIGKVLEETYLEDCKGENCQGEAVTLKDKMPTKAPPAKKKR